MQQEEIVSENVRYGAVFCKTGAEDEVIRNAQHDWPQTEFLTAKIVKKRTDKLLGGDCYREEDAFPGYIFFRAPQDFSPVGHPLDLYKVLTVEKFRWQLEGHDAEFVKWLFDQNGKIGLSKAYREGDRIVIQEGPLKDLEGYITHVDKRNAKGQVELEVNGRKLRVWLCFEWVATAKQQETV